MPNSPSRFERTRCVRRGWIFERAGWAAMAVTALAGAVGLLGGGGVLSRADAAAGADLNARHLRFGRAGAPQHLIVEWRPHGETATLWIAQSYLEAVEIEEILPPPDFAEGGPDRILYTFRIGEPGKPMQVRFATRPARAGAVAGRIGIADGPDVEIRQFVFP